MYEFDRYLRYDELSSWLSDLADRHPNLVALDAYGRSFEGRDLLIVTVTDTTTGSHESKPAHWVDASIHATELTATVAACWLLQHLVDGYERGDELVTRALKSRTFYVVPRVNPDGAEWALADSPRFRRSSVRPWPRADAHRWPGLLAEDIDGDGRILQMRIPDPNGAWIAHPDDARLLVAMPLEGPPSGTTRYRLLAEGSIENFDGFTIPTPRAPEGLDLNRNFPAGWGTKVVGAGDHPLSEPEVDALVRAIVARPNICGYNAFHTSGGVLLRPSSTATDSALPPQDLWVWKELSAIGTALTDYPAHSVFDDFTWDRSTTMSGAADDWAYEHLGIFGWTTEFWDIVLAATGTKQSTHFWYTGPTAAEALAVLQWCDAEERDHPSVDERSHGYVDWYAFDHPQLGPVELGGWNTLHTWTNPPLRLLRAEVAGHAEFAVRQALAAPCVEIIHRRVTRLGDDTWRVEIGVANTGWLPTYVSQHAQREHIVDAITVELGAADGASIDVLDGPAVRAVGHLEGASAGRFTKWNDGTPDRLLASWVVRAPQGTRLVASVRAQRAGQRHDSIVLQ